MATDIRNLRANAAAATRRHRRLDQVALSAHADWRSELHYGNDFSEVDRLAQRAYDADTRANAAAAKAAEATHRLLAATRGIREARVMRRQRAFVARMLADASATELSA